MNGEKLTNYLLIVLIVMCLGIVVLGGYVRLSGSGLSIPEWPFFTIEKQVQADGSVNDIKTIFPPTTEESWQILYTTLVTELPQYEGTAMSEFKRMFWTEWSHRGVAKLIGVVYLAFMGVVFYFPELRRKLSWLSVIGLVVLVSQAVMGGIVVLFHLDSAKIAIHLLAAFLFTAILLWCVLKLKRPAVERSERTPFNPITIWTVVAIAMISLQLFSGGLMAGSLAGFQMNTWPMMGEVWMPNGIVNSDMSFLKNFTENVIMIQFFHRWFAFMVIVALAMLVFRCMTVRVSTQARWALRSLFAIVVFQTILGVLTLITGVHNHLALTHQFVGLILLLVAVVILYETTQHPVLMEEQLVDLKEKESEPPTLQEKAPANA